ncbi:uncharacterized protein LY89DRAFT_211728 [Mollisia scopiformis]|uniref:2EXR domain-containing protein n=1 Tax=Mollisia scopiformis TaxID=149040 RepID=A0A194WY88_MOLSC|nr:uncharacterized protein LY89DRAFT_211728 [Mollisia scopiformis]KUJ12649.1 hypothetical protein LY89DRAFT_211728 [Mollisia scopiformis]
MGNGCSKPSAVFQKFPEFPLDIQLLVWEHAIQGIPARVVALRRGTELNDIPALLHTCHDSRTLALQRYEWTENKKGHGRRAYPPRMRSYFCFIDYELDSVYLPPLKYSLKSSPSLISSSAYGTHLRNLRTIIILWKFSVPWQSLLKPTKIAKFCPNLRKLIIVKPGYRGPGGRFLELVASEPLQDILEIYGGVCVQRCHLKRWHSAALKCSVNCTKSFEKLEVQELHFKMYLNVQECKRYLWQKGLESRFEIVPKQNSFKTGFRLL